MQQEVKFWFLRDRLVFGLVILFSLTGALTWFSINEQEDPFFPYRNGFVTITAPAMSANAIEQTIVKSLERALASVDEVSAITTEVADGSASVDVELQESIEHTDRAWQRVRDVVNEQKVRFSDLVSEFELQDRAQDTAGILLAIKTDRPLMEARQYALYVRDELYKLSHIREIALLGDPGAQIEIHYPQSAMLQHGISPLSIAEKVKQANALHSAGVLKGQRYQSPITPFTRLDSLEEIKDVQIGSIDNEVLKLADIAEVNLVAVPLQTQSFWLQGKQTIGLSVVVPPNQLRIVDFGETLMTTVDRLNRLEPAFQIERVFFQPEWTQKRRDGLVESLFLASVGVGLVLFLLMSRKLALVVSVTIPAIALTSIALFGMLGGVLQQMSIAGLVISLGLMVDNSIVMSELIARYREQGDSAIQASHKSIRALYKPLAASTLTTVAAFVPMLLSQGNVADFIRMIPVIVILSIMTSYLYALVLLPAMTNNLRKFETGKRGNRFVLLGRKLAKLPTRRPRMITGGFILLILVSVLSGPDGAGEFFPKSSRNQAFIDIEGAYGASHEATKVLVTRVEAIAGEVDEITRLISFIGHSGPRFYYNLSESPNEPHVARVVFETQSSEDVPAVVDRLNQRFQEEFYSPRVRARQIGQGPPIESPIEIRVLGDDQNRLITAAEAIFRLLDQHEHTVDTRRGYVPGKPKLGFDVNESDLFKAALNEIQLSDFMAWRTTGIHVTQIPMQRESVDVVMRDSPKLVKNDGQYLLNTMLMNEDDKVYPMSLFVTPKVQGMPPYLTRRNGFSFKSVLADVESGSNEEDILQGLMSELKDIENQHQVTLEFGGEMEEEEESGGALLKTLPIGAMMLFSVLVVQFNSFRITSLIMLTIPMAMIGVPPMLAIAGVNFGFMSMLGLLALAGVVVNTAIILIDTVLVKVKRHGVGLKCAIEQAVEERFRPVMLTAITTIVSMIPLTSPLSPLWPPLAWTMIGGLITSTLLTLIVLPSLLLMILNEKKLRAAD